jgi:hypothetical protein
MLRAAFKLPVLIGTAIGGLCTSSAHANTPAMVSANRASVDAASAPSEVRSPARTGFTANRRATNMQKTTTAIIVSGIETGRKQ